MVTTTVSSNIPLDVGVAIENESKNRRISVSQLIREVLIERYKAKGLIQ